MVSVRALFVYLTANKRQKTNERHEEERRQEIVHFCHHPGCDFNNVIKDSVREHYQKLHSPRGREL